MNPFRHSPISSPTQFTSLYNRGRLPVFRYIYGLTGGPQDLVEDLTAETFLRAWKARRRFDGDENAAIGWLIRIAKRLVIDDYRRRTVREAHNAMLELPSEPLPEQAALANEQKQRLLALLEDLPAETRELLVLRYLLGWRVSEIAGHLDASENSVSVALHRALARLRAGWAENEPKSLPVLFPSEEKI